MELVLRRERQQLHELLRLAARPSRVVDGLSAYSDLECPEEIDREGRSLSVRRRLPHQRRIPYTETAGDAETPLILRHAQDER